MLSAIVDYTRPTETTAAVLFGHTTFSSLYFEFLSFLNVYFILLLLVSTSNINKSHTV